MNYKYFLLIYFIFIVSCEHHNSKIVFKEETKVVKKINEVDKKVEKNIVKKIDSENDNFKKLKVYNNKGFALIYSENLVKKKIVNKKINENSLIIYIKSLENNTPIKITNLINGKYIVTKSNNNINYPIFYNSMISEKLANEILINSFEPYVKIESLNSNKVIVVNDAKTYDEEKNVANKAPIDTIIIQNIGIANQTKKEKIKKINKVRKNFKYIIKFADLYFEDSAIMLKERLMNEFNIKNISIKKLSKDNYRVFIGPFNDLGSLKKAYIDMNNIDFENIEIIKL